MLKPLFVVLTYFETDEIKNLMDLGKAKDTLSSLVELGKYCLALAGIFAAIYAFKHYVKGDDGGSESTFLKIAVGLAVCAIMMYVIQAVAFKIGT